MRSAVARDEQTCNRRPTHGKWFNTVVLFVLDVLLIIALVNLLKQAKAMGQRVSWQVLSLD
jgi:hypothetical protein